MTSELQRIAAELLAVLDEIPGLAEQLHRYSDKTKRQAGHIGDLSRGSDQGRHCALMLFDAAQRIDEAAKLALPAHTQGRPWALSLTNIVTLSTTATRDRRHLATPPASATVLVDRKFRYETDEAGRVVKAFARLKVIDLDHPRNKNAQRTTKDKIADVDDAGHLFARIFQGPGNRINLVAMEAMRVNRSEYKQIESTWREAIENRQEVEVSIDIDYDDDGFRPAFVYVAYTIDGVEYKEAIDNDPYLGRHSDES